MTLTKEEIKQKRQYIFSKAQKTTNIRKGDKRIASATRLCAVCGRPLSKLVLTNGSAIVTTDHVSCKISDLVRLNMCEDIRSCYAYTSKKGEE